MDNHFVEIVTNLGWFCEFLLAKLNTVEKRTFLVSTMLKILDFVQFYMIMINEGLNSIICESTLCGLTLH